MNFEDYRKQLPTIKVTEQNISYIEPYQGSESYNLKIGDILTIIHTKIPCVYEVKGQARTFAILTNFELTSNTKQFNPDYEVEEHCYHWRCFRWSLNSKFLPTKIQKTKIEYYKNDNRN